MPKAIFFYDTQLPLRMRSTTTRFYIFKFVLISVFEFRMFNNFCLWISRAAWRLTIWQNFVGNIFYSLMVLLTEVAMTSELRSNIIGAPWNETLVEHQTPRKCNVSQKVDYEPRAVRQRVRVDAAFFTTACAAQCYRVRIIPNEFRCKYDVLSGMRRPVDCTRIVVIVIVRLSFGATRQRKVFRKKNIALSSRPRSSSVFTGNR
jgi:hypothetical protein